MLEYASNGNLFTYMKSRSDSGMDVNLAAKIYLQVCEAVNFLHSHNIIHRDIKPENILLDKNYNAKLCDFGWSTEVERNEVRGTFCGTYEYMAPEIFENEEYNSSIDIWSLGVLLYEMLHSKSPFVGNSVFKIFKNILKEDIKFKRDIDPNAADLILRILKTDPNKRPTIEALLQHPYFHTYKKYNLIDIDEDYKYDANNNYHEIVNDIEDSIDSSNGTEDDLLEQELRDFVSDDMKVDNNTFSQNDQRPTKKEINNSKGFDVSFKKNPPVVNQTSIRNRISNLSGSGFKKGLKDKSLLLSNKTKYEMSPNKHKKTLSIYHSDKDLSHLYRMKNRGEINNNSKKQLEAKLINHNKKPHNSLSKDKRPQTLRSFFKNKVEEYVFDKNVIKGKASPCDNTNLYLKHKKDKSTLNTALYTERLKTPPSNYTSNENMKIYPTSKPIKNFDITPKINKLNFSKAKNSMQANTTTFINSSYKKFPSEQYDKKGLAKDNMPYSSVDQMINNQKPKKLLNNKQGLFNKKPTMKNQPKNNTYDNKNSNINIVINKFYDKTKIYCHADEISSPQKMTSKDHKLSNKTFESSKNKRSNKVLPETTF